MKNTPARGRGPMRIVLAALVLLSGAALAEEAAQRVVHTLDYMRVDYPEAVHEGRVRDAHEYEEMQEFAEEIESALRTLPRNEAQAGLVQQAAELRRLVEQKAAAEQVAQLTRRMGQAVMRAYALPEAPDRAPDLRAAAQSYRALCVNCHGRDGRGDGPLAGPLQPPPTDFHDAQRQNGRSVLGLYNAISLGVEETAMAGYAGQLSEAERWALAFYVSNFLFDDTQRARGAELWGTDRHADGLDGPAALTQATPAQLERELGADGLALLAFLRSAPEHVFEH